VIYIGGSGVALGYHGDYEKTTYQFVRHPETGEYLFRTGDLGRVHPDGLIEILGREDNQVKVNGFRVELGEIERVMEEDEAVVRGAVAVQDGALYGYVVLAQGAGGTGGKLSDENEEEGVDDDKLIALEALNDEITTRVRIACETALPRYMVPRGIVTQAKLPLTGNGKVDRKRLPLFSTMAAAASAASSGGASSDPNAPPVVLTATEAAICGIFTQILGEGANGETIKDPSSDFFALGGDSLTVLRLLIALEKEVGERLSVPTFFSHSSVGSLAALVDRKREASGNASNKAEDAVKVGRHLQLLPLSKPYKKTTTHEGKGGEEGKEGKEGGEEESPLLILIHPAGAGGMCYRELSAELGAGVEVIAIDDPFLSSDKGAPFPFTTLKESAADALDLVQHVITKPGGILSETGTSADTTSPTTYRPYVLGGWSYGGVVALEVAAALTSRGTPPASLALFDAPMTVAPVTDPALLEAFQGPTGNSGEGEDDEMAGRARGRAREHFEECSRLLRGHPTRAQVECPVLYVHPASGGVGEGPTGSPGDIEGLSTGGAVTQTVVPGTHWTMLFDEGSEAVAKALSPYLRMSNP
jgi:pimeloyl-ACP methyl ester carboxylesterase/acyl carrier protein